MRTNINAGMTGPIATHQLDVHRYMAKDARDIIKTMFIQKALVQRGLCLFADIAPRKMDRPDVTISSHNVIKDKFFV